MCTHCTVATGRSIFFDLLFRRPESRESKCLCAVNIEIRWWSVSSILLSSRSGRGRRCEGFVRQWLCGRCPSQRTPEGRVTLEESHCGTMLCLQRKSWRTELRARVQPACAILWQNAAYGASAKSNYGGALLCCSAAEPNCVWWRVDGCRAGARSALSHSTGRLEECTGCCILGVCSFVCRAERT